MSPKKSYPIVVCNNPLSTEGQLGTQTTKRNSSSQEKFEALATLPHLEQYGKSFKKATGVSFQVIPMDEKALCSPAGKFLHAFCGQIALTPLGCSSCMKSQKRLKFNIDNKQGTQKYSCFAGFTKVAIPIINGERHIATLMSEPVFRGKRTESDFKLVAEKLGGDLGNAGKTKARKAYFETPVITEEKFEALTELLDVFVQHLPQDVNRHVLACSSIEPLSVSNAKTFLQSHYDAPITLEQVLKHVHVSRFHFCKIFKKSTGITLTEYTARLRVEKAKELLLKSDFRISDVVFASGFGSIPQFNNVFKRIVGMPPTAYRMTLRTQ